MKKPTPKLDVARIDRTPLTLEIASIHPPKLNHEQRAMRLLAAIHEAAHFVSMVEEGDQVFTVSIAVNPVSKRHPAGMVQGLRNTMYEREYITTRMGMVTEWALLNHDTGLPPVLSLAAVNDGRQSEQEALAWYSYQADMERLDGTVDEAMKQAFAPSQPAQDLRYLARRWELIDLCATAFLLHADKSGGVSQAIVREIQELVQFRLIDRAWPCETRSSRYVTFRDKLGSDIVHIWRHQSPDVPIADSLSQ